ncbi:MAG: hypothetical protein BGO76_07670 [Caedibacter sp. 38-128]|nr:hypothetical protein [Holosporales bacterium]OJX04880.1 MAG: hypothetical protein BGO76_07670 [Caedibacter sp. 38-128]
MWSKSYSNTFKNLKKERVWALWEDVNNRHKWDLDSEYCKLEDSFEVGAKFILKPIGAPVIQIEIIDVRKNHKFTDRTRFWGAIMDGIHEMEETKDGLKLTTTIQISGPLSFLWRKLVADGIVKTLPEQTEALAALAGREDD